MGPAVEHDQADAALVLRLHGLPDAVDVAAPAGTTGHERIRLEPGHELGEQSYADLYWTTSSALDAVRVGLGPDHADDLTAFRRLDVVGEADAGPAAGLLFVLTNCTDPDDTERYRAWYVEHLQHVVDNVDFFSASLFAAEGDGPRVSQYMAVYETRSDDVARAWTELMTWWGTEGAAAPDTLALQARLLGHPEQI